MPSKIARTGKVNVAKYGIILEQPGQDVFIFAYHPTLRFARRHKERLGECPHYKIVRLSGTVTYTLAK